MTVFSFYLVNRSRKATPIAILGLVLFSTISALATAQQTLAGTASTPLSPKGKEFHRGVGLPRSIRAQRRVVSDLQEVSGGDT
jgi:hypothetical protein